jgi:5-methylcytosine-specific restriction protein A
MTTHARSPVLWAFCVSGLVFGVWLGGVAMGRLKLLAPSLTTLRPKLGRVSDLVKVAPLDRDAARDRDQHWRKWYKTARWQRLRWQVLERDQFTCRLCSQIEVDTSQLVGDHITAHRGDAALFWDDTNLQCLCKTCHDSIKQREERSGTEGGWVKPYTPPTP